MDQDQDRENDGPDLDLNCFDTPVVFLKDIFEKVNFKQEGQEALNQSPEFCLKQALNQSPEFCLKLTYRYVSKAGHVPGDTWGAANFGPTGII